MAFRSKRQKRYAYLIDKGFLLFEAQAMSKVPRKVPYIPTVIASRVKLRNRAKRDNWSATRYRKYILDMYRTKGWMTLTRRGKQTYSPWAMMRDAEDRYKDKHPEYKSPWLRKQKQWRDFQSKYARGEEKYPRGAAYKGKGK